MVRMKGLEPPHISTPEPKSGASTNFATSAKNNNWYRRLDSNQPHPNFQSGALPDELRRYIWRKAEESNPIRFLGTWFSRPVAGPTPLHYFPFFFGLGSRNRTYAPTSQTSSDTISPYRENINWESFVARRAQPWAHGAVVVAVELLVHRWHLLCL
jgi:hypothetical protein